MGLRSGSGTIETLAPGSEVAVTVGTAAVDLGRAGGALGLRSGGVSDLVVASVEAFGLRSGGREHLGRCQGLPPPLACAGQYPRCPVVVASPGVEAVGRVGEALRG